MNPEIEARLLQARDEIEATLKKYKLNLVGDNDYCGCYLTPNKSLNSEEFLNISYEKF